MDQPLKFLLAIASICVIGLTAWYGFVQYRLYDYNKNYKRYALCQHLTDQEWIARNYDLRYVESRRLLEMDTDRCLGLS